MQAILDKVIKKIKPTPAEIKRFQKVSNQFIQKINSQFKDAKAILGGSGEKDTWLSGSHDVDVFLQFNYPKFKGKSDQISDLAEEKLKKIFPRIQRVHGSRDYFQLKYQSFDFEIIPILKITKKIQAKNITDISPLHAQWVKKQGGQIVDEIRLVKKFARAQGCYGAESYINGLSGYVLEILTVHYGSFENLLKAAVQWESKVTMDAGKHYKHPKEIFRTLNQSKLKSAIIVIDPVDKDRNAAAAFDLEKFFLFRYKAAEFLKNPQLIMFDKQRLNFQKLEKETLFNLAYVEVTPLTGKNDVVGSKLLKVFNFLKKKLTEFEIEDSGWDWEGNGQFYFILKKRQVDPFIIKQGPPVKMADAVKAFQKANKNTYEERGRLMVKIPIKHFKLADYLKNSLEDPYVKERIKLVRKVLVG